MPLTVLAHTTPGFGNLGLSLWFVMYGLVVILGLTFLAARAQAASIELPPADPAEVTATTMTSPRHRFGRWGPMAALTQAAGVAMFVVLAAAALAGDPALGSNPAPLTVDVAFFLGVPVLSVVLGDIWSPLSPFTGLATVLDRLRRRPTTEATPTEGDWWVPALLLLSFEAWSLAVVDGTLPRHIGAWLIAYAVVMVAGALLGGREWCRRNDPFGMAFSVFASLAPVVIEGGRCAWRRPLRRLAEITATRRTAAVLAVLAGSIAYDHASNTNWWQAHLSNHLDQFLLSVINVTALVWCVVLLAVAWSAASRLTASRSARAASDDGGEPSDQPDPSGAALTVELSPALVPFTVGLFIAYALPRLLVGMQNVVILASDPFGRGWNLFGTLDLAYNAQPLSPSAIGWAQIALVTVGVMATVAVLQQRLVRRFGTGRRPASGPLLVFVLVVTLGGVRLVLGA